MTPLRRRVPVPVLVALLLGATVAGCSSGEATEPSPEPTVATTVAAAPPSEASPTPTSPTPDPTPSSTLDEEQTAAAATVLEFFRLKNELGQDPYLEFEPLANITTGQTQVIQMSTIDQYRLDGMKQTGDTAYSLLSVGPVVVDDDSKTIDIDACTDATNIDVVDVDTGQSVLPADRQFFVHWNIVVIHEGYRWKVGDILSDTVEGCSP